MERIFYLDEEEKKAKSHIEKREIENLKRATRAQRKKEMDLKGVDNAHSCKARITASKEKAKPKAKVKKEPGRRQMQKGNGRSEKLKKKTS